MTTSSVAAGTQIPRHGVRLVAATSLVLLIVVIVGGMGSLKGALIGSVMVGLLDNFGKALFPELSYFTLFAPMAAILAVRPTGLFGRA